MERDSSFFESYFMSEMLWMLRGKEVEILLPTISTSFPSGVDATNEFNAQGVQMNKSGI